MADSPYSTGVVYQPTTLGGLELTTVLWPKTCSFTHLLSLSAASIMASTCISRITVRNKRSSLRKSSSRWLNGEMIYFMIIYYVWDLTTWGYSATYRGETTSFDIPVSTDQSLSLIFLRSIHPCYQPNSLSLAA